jgi:hypothetical protein
MAGIDTSLDYTTLLSVFKDHVAVVNTLWGIFHIVALALLGFVYKEEHLRNSGLVLLGFTIGFLIFAFGNQQAMLRSERVLAAVDQQFTPDALATVQRRGIRPVLEAYEARTQEQVRFGHNVYIFLVVAALWMPFVVDRFKEVRQGKRINVDNSKT